MSELVRLYLVLKIFLMLYRFPTRLKFSETFFTYGIYVHRAQGLLFFIQTTATLGINDRVNETLGITIELEITSQAADFIKQILSFLAYGGSSIVKTLNQTSFHMLRMVGVEVEISASVGGFPVDFAGQCRLLPDDQNTQKGNRTV
jgi:hypothetical protein